MQENSKISKVLKQANIADTSRPCLRSTIERSDAIVPNSDVFRPISICFIHYIHICLVVTHVRNNKLERDFLTVTTLVSVTIVMEPVTLRVRSASVCAVNAACLALAV